MSRRQESTPRQPSTRAPSSSSRSRTSTSDPEPAHHDGDRDYVPEPARARPSAYEPEALEEEPSWGEIMTDMDRSARAQELVYNSLLTMVKRYKNGGTLNYTAMEALLNKTVPITESDRKLELAVCYFGRLKRGGLIEFLFKARRACLLMLLDGRGVAVALGVEDSLEIWRDEDGYHVAPAAEGQPHASRGTDSADGDGRRRRRRDRRGGRGRDRDREGGSPRRDARPPVMNADQVQDALAALDGELEPQEGDVPQEQEQQEQQEQQVPTSQEVAQPPIHTGPSDYLNAARRGTGGKVKPPPKAPAPKPKPAPKPEPAAEAGHADEPEDELGDEAEAETEAKAEPGQGLGAPPATEPPAASAPKAQPAPAAPAPKAQPAPAAPINWADDEDEDGDTAAAAQAPPRVPDKAKPAARGPPASAEKKKK